MNFHLHQKEVIADLGVLVNNMQKDIIDLLKSEKYRKYNDLHKLVCDILFLFSGVCINYANNNEYDMRLKISALCDCIHKSDIYNTPKNVRFEFYCILYDKFIKDKIGSLQHCNYRTKKLLHLELGCNMQLCAELLEKEFSKHENSIDIKFSNFMEKITCGKV